MFKKRCTSKISNDFLFHFKSSNEEEVDNTAQVMRPIMLLIFINGIDMKASRIINPVIVFSIFFHLMCFGIIVFKVLWLIEEFEWNIFVTLALKVIALVLWWIVCIKRKSIYSVLLLISHLDSNTGKEDYKKLRILSTIASLCLILIMLVTPTILSVRYTKPDSELPKGLQKYLPSDKTSQEFVIMLHEYVSVFVNMSITHSSALFYTFCCINLFFCLKHKCQSEAESWKMYKNMLEIFVTIEKNLGLIVFIEFAHVFASLFKDMIILIHIFKSKHITTLYFYLVDFLLNAAITCIIVFSAAAVQNIANDVREKLFSFTHSHNEKSLMDLNNRYIKLTEDRKRLKLTAWGMFDIRKPLLITLVTGLISYGVIILQFSD